MEKIFNIRDFSRSSSFDSSNTYYSDNDCDCCTFEGIFHPKPNIYICKVHCCLKFIGLYIFLFGCIFGISFPFIGIKTKLIIFTIVGVIIFVSCLIPAILLFFLLTVEVKFTFSHSMVEIIVSSVCWKKRQNVDKKEISEIFFEYSQRRRYVYNSLHIKFNNGIENNYFSFTSSPPCFSKFEVDFFNNEMKKNLRNDYNNL